MQDRVNLSGKIILLGMVLPLCFAPLLAVEFPRVLAFLPLITLLFALPAFLKTRAEPLRSFTKPAVFFAICLVLMFLHSFCLAQYHDDAYERLTKLSIIVTCGILFLASLKMLPPIQEKYLHLMLWFCALGAVLTSFEILSGEVLYRFIRQLGPQEHVSTAVYNRGSLSITFLAALAGFLLNNKKQISVYAAFTAIVIMLFLGESQSAQLIFGVVLAFYFLWPTTSKMGWVVLYGGIVIAALSAPFVVPYLFNNLPAFVNDVTFFRQGYVGPRFEIWDYVSRKIYENPIWGHGLEFTKNFKDFDSQQRYTNVTTVLHPHNFILQLWIEFGLCGILVFLTGLGMFLRFLYINLSGNHRHTALTMLMSFLFVSCFSYGIWQSWWLGLAFVICGWLSLSINQDKQQRIA